MLYDNGKEVNNSNELQSNNLKAVLTFNINQGDEILAKVGISSVDEAGAQNNLETEINSWEFEEVKDSTHKTWVNQLNKITVTGGSENEKTIFYTALYHTSLSPYLFSDVDGRYRGMDKQNLQFRRKKYLYCFFRYGILSGPFILY